MRLSSLFLSLSTAYFCTFPSVGPWVGPWSATPSLLAQQPAPPVNRETPQANNRSALVTAPKAEASHPNLVFAVRRQGVGQILEKMQRKFEESRFGTHQIVGVPVSGTTKTSGEVFASLHPEEDRVDLLFEMKGNAHSPYNTAAQGPARVFTSARTSLQGSTRVVWDGRHLVAKPCEANCQTQTTTLGVSVERRRLLRRSEGGLIDRVISNAASSRAAQLRGQSEAESSRLAEARIRERMGQEVEAKLKELNAKIDEHYNEPLDRNGIWAPSRVKLMDEYLALALTQPDHNDHAAAEPANFDEINADFVFAVHETSIAGFLRPLFSGTYWSDRDVAQLQKMLLGDVCYEYHMGDQTRWSIVFDSEQPITAKMENGGITLIVRGQQATIDGQQIQIPWIVRTNYLVCPTRTSLSFVRQGGVYFEWAGEATQATEKRDQAEKILRDKFAGFFLPKLHLDGIDLPRGGQWEKLHMTHIDDAQVRGGWLYLASLPNVSIWSLKPPSLQAMLAR